MQGRCSGSASVACDSAHKRCLQHTPIKIEMLSLRKTVWTAGVSLLVLPLVLLILEANQENGENIIMTIIVSTDMSVT